MPRPRPFVALHGQVDFNSLVAVEASVDSDIFVCRQGALGDNVFTTRAEIRNPAVGEQFLAQDGTAALPGYAWANDPDTGFLRAAANEIRLATNAITRFRFTSSQIRGNITDSFSLINELASATNPSVAPANSDIDTGLGWISADIGTFVAGGVEVARYVEAAGVVQFIVPLQANSTFPSIAFGDGDTGFHESFDDTLTLAIAGSGVWQFSSSRLGASNGNRPSLLNLTPSATIPNIVSNSLDLDTGVGHPADDALSLIAGTLDCINISEVGAARLIGFYVTAPIVLQTGVAVTAAGVHAALVNLGLITA